MEKIEVEIRTFISSSQYKKLIKKLKKIAKFKGEANEETVYCGSEKLRIRRDDRRSYLILKSGKIHQNFRSETEIKFKRKDFEKMKEIFEKIGFPVTAIWKRKRLIFAWKGIKILLDDTQGYGKIIELEKITDEKNKEKAFLDLKSKLQNLGIKKITPKEVFDQKFNYYLKNWQKLI
jgi:predicted adenylyl cyclase CyaB